MNTSSANILNTCAQKKRNRKDKQTATCSANIGFIQVEGQDSDVFVHQSDIYAPGFRSLAEGEPVEFKMITDERNGKLKAVEVTGPDGAYVQGAPKRNYDGDGGEEDYY